jgi:hypothetical protein
MVVALNVALVTIRPGKELETKIIISAKYKIALAPSQQQRNFRLIGC